MKVNYYSNRRKLRRLYCAIFLISFSLISFEIILSRLLSIVLSYHYVFLVLSLALLGLGVGGLVLHLIRLRTPCRTNSFFFLANFAFLFSMAIVLAVITIIHVDLQDILSNNIVVYCFILFVPFLFAGVLLSGVYRMFSSLSAKIYSADLIGGAIGSLGGIQFLNIFGGIISGFLLSAGVSIVALLFAWEERKENKKAFILPTISSLITFTLLTINITGYYRPSIPIHRNKTKEIYDALSIFKGKIVKTKWSAFGRTDLIEFNDHPDQMDIYIDGTAGSPMYRFSGNPKNPGPAVNHLKRIFPGYFPFFLLKEGERKNALIIGPGGGRDILLALMGEVKKITAVEINRDLVHMIRSYSSFNGGLYSNLENVEIVVGEGRHFLSRQNQKYDIIMLSLPVTNTSRSLEGFSLTENFLFTTDSIGDYLNHLSDDGRLIVVAHDDAEILRLVSTSINALRKKGIRSSANAMNHIYITGSESYLVFVLKKKPFEKKESVLRYRTMKKVGLDPLLSYFPYIIKTGALNPALTDLGRGKITLETLENMVREKGYDISPVTDNSPFFYKFEIGIPISVSIVFWVSSILLLFTLIFYFIFRRDKSEYFKINLKERGYFSQRTLQLTLLFSMIGMGFMVIEISLVQRFVLFLGRPLLSLAVLLFSLLTGASIGSLCSGRLTIENANKGIQFSSLFFAIIIITYTFLFTLIFNRFLEFNLLVRMGISTILILPIGFLAGFPFPLGIRTLKEMKMENHIPWMWGINCLSSVLGSALTIILAINFGFTESLLIGAGCYFIVFLAFIKPKFMNN